MQIMKIQVFKFKNNHGVDCTLNTDAMRKWAEINLKIEFVDVDDHKVMDIIKNGRVDINYIRNHKLHTNPKTILVCDDFISGLSEIVDGNHTYVAFSLAKFSMLKAGIKVPGSLLAPAYRLKKAEWTMFLSQE